MALLGNLLARLGASMFAAAESVTAGVVIAFNLLLAALGAALAAALGLLPSLPAVPTFSGTATAVGWISYFVPVGVVLTYVGSLLTGYLVFLGVRFILKRTGML